MNKKKFKVLHIVGGMDLGGTETMLMNLYREVYDLIQFDFISYYEKDAYYDNEIKELGGEIIKIDSPSKVGQIKAIINLYKIIKQGKYEIVHAHTLFNCGIVMLAAKLAGAKIRISHSHTNLDMSNNIIKKLYFYLMRGVIKVFSTDFVACSESAGKYLFGENIIKNSKYKVLHNYINYNKFLQCEDYKSIREELVIKEDDIVVGHIGRFVDAKNHKFLIDIINDMVKANSKIKAILVGDGPLRKEIEDKVEALGIRNNIYFLGLRNDIDVILNNCDLFIFPSIYEGLGLVILEAQACGLPCIVSEAIQHEADLEIGLLNRLQLKNSSEEWSNKALELVGKRQKDKVNIKNVFKNKGYELNQIVNSLLKIYKIN
ncbi:glycosyltransferase family 1 protein [Clostridium perfringens]